MSNLIIKNFEMLFIRNEILKKYTGFAGIDCATFEKELTGYRGAIIFNSPKITDIINRVSSLGSKEKLGYRQIKISQQVSVIPFLSN